jgi:hypothetical protein
MQRNKVAKIKTAKWNTHILTLGRDKLLAPRFFVFSKSTLLASPPSAVLMGKECQHHEPLGVLDVYMPLTPVLR